MLHTLTKLTALFDCCIYLCDRSSANALDKGALRDHPAGLPRNCIADSTMNDGTCVTAEQPTDQHRFTTTMYAF